MTLTVSASSTGASAIRGGAMRSRRGAKPFPQQPQQQQHQQRQQPQQRQQQHATRRDSLVSRTRAASPLVGAGPSSRAPQPLAAARPKAAAAQAPAPVAAAAAAAEAPAPAAPAAKKDPATTPFTNTQRFVVAPASSAAFQAAWREREAAMRQQPGFGGLSIVSDGLSGDTVVSAKWASIADFERWMADDACRRSHLPPGVWQYVPKRGEGFPEDFVPFVAYDEAVNAKYF